MQVFENLTPLEMLYYAALLRLPRTMSKEAKLDRVNTVILALGLEKCSNTIIGTLQLALLCTPLSEILNPNQTITLGQTIKGL